MRFKIDENLPSQVATVLNQEGHYAATIGEQQMVGEPDPQVIAVCLAERRALITLDLDFSDIRTYQPSSYPGSIVLRPGSQSKPDVLKLIDRLLPLLEKEPLEGKLWILQETGLRIREN